MVFLKQDNARQLSTIKKIINASRTSLKQIELHGKLVKSDTSVANFLTC